MLATGKFAKRYTFQVWMLDGSSVQVDAVCHQDAEREASRLAGVATYRTDRDRHLATTVNRSVSLWAV